MRILMRTHTRPVALVIKLRWLSYIHGTMLPPYQMWTEKVSLHPHPWVHFDKHPPTLPLVSTYLHLVESGPLVAYRIPTL